jgi:hypothetical protein
MSAFHTEEEPEADIGFIYRVSGPCKLPTHVDRTVFVWRCDLRVAVDWHALVHMLLLVSQCIVWAKAAVCTRVGLCCGLWSCCIDVLCKPTICPR